MTLDKRAWVKLQVDFMLCMVLGMYLLLLKHLNTPFTKEHIEMGADALTILKSTGDNLFKLRDLMNGEKKDVETSQEG